ncbi:hypothetical protein BGZ65_011129 [Modicella reniformis]|uniref:HhH-GPD domain-containing protein n=1 Tax=Modicella reniformis TaxID=1440133 RepID=A0A9P6SUU0_9FUNG|nr:hypothetical protein BGZ65_011129 [Modicella reniformis]
MSTRSSSRLRVVRVRADHAESSVPKDSRSLPGKAGATHSTRITRSSRGIVKNEDGEPDEQTLTRLMLEADEYRKALSAEKRAKRTSTASTVNSIKRSKGDEQGGGGSNGQTTVKKSKLATKEPVGWEITLDRLREFRLQNPAPVDTMGCERLAEAGVDVPPETVFMKRIAEICKTKYDGDIPGTAEELIALPGVGPKMAYLTLQVAWNKNLGIGVDTHVHRIANRLGWVKTEKDGPEGTREALQSWLPKEHWREINYILVGFGQVLCLPRGPLCNVCPVQERCPSATGVSKQKKRLLATVKSEMEEPFGEVEIHVANTSHENSNIQSADETVKTEEETVKQEPDEETSPYFANESNNGVGIKEEVQEDAIGYGINLHGVNSSVNTSNLDKEAADIEDLVS